jgi:hypothetical protein
MEVKAGTRKGVAVFERAYSFLEAGNERCHALIGIDLGSPLRPRIVNLIRRVGVRYTVGPADELPRRSLSSDDLTSVG